MRRPRPPLLDPALSGSLQTVGFADLDAYGAYADRIAADEQWQAFWAAAMANPSADLIRSGVSLNISG